VSWGHTLAEFALLAGGGVAVGVVTALGAFLIRRRTEDPVLETVVALVTPYGGYVLAEAIGASGVTAVVVASVILGTQATRLTTARIRLQTGAVYETVVFLLESVVFGLIGLQLPTLVRQLTDTDSTWPLHALVIAATLVVVRLLWVFPLSAIVQRRRGDRPSWQVPAVVSWAGARGVVPLAASLSIPLTTQEGVPLPYRELVLLLTIAVIVVTLVVQGFTLAPLVRRAGIAADPQDVRHEHINARLHLARAGLAHLEQLAESETVPEFAVDQLRHSWQARIDRIQTHETQEPDSSAGMAYLRLRREILAVESAELTRLFNDGTITDTTRRRIQRQLDLEHAGLGEDE
jgi:NhaP-type Na+/H+ or K+/H+ antiporter